MISNSQDKKSLIQSMKKLTYYISNNSQRQKQIFNSLSKTDLLKLFSNLSDENQYLRRVSGLLLCELLYNNVSTKQGLISKMQILPTSGRIIINKIPDSIQKYPTTLKKCLELLKSTIRREEINKMCWMINLDRRSLQLQFLQYKKYSSFTFLDPSRNLFGFTLADPDFRSRQASIERSIRLGSREKQPIRNSSRDSYNNYPNNSRFSTDTQQRLSIKHFKTSSQEIPKQIQHEILTKPSLEIPQNNYIHPRQQLGNKLKLNHTIDYDLRDKQPSPSTKFQIFASKKQDRFQYYKNITFNNTNKSTTNQNNVPQLSFKPKSTIVEGDRQFEKMKTERVHNPKQGQIKSMTIIQNSLTQRQPIDLAKYKNDNFYKRVKEILKK